MSSPNTITDKFWGWERLWAQTDRYAAKVLHIMDGKRLSLQFHRLKDETLIVTKGKLELFIEGQGSKTLEPGMSAHIEAGTTHRLGAASGCGECEVIEVSSPELSDVVRLEDDYGREGTEETPLG